MLNDATATDRADPLLLLVVAAALTDADGRVLVQRRPPGGAHAGLWEFPGGKVEPGERPADALARELREELGIAIDPADARAAGFAEEAGGRHLLLLLYALHRWAGEPPAGNGAALRWVEPPCLGELPMPPADVPLARMLAER